jgi:hypothetical protein
MPGIFIENTRKGRRIIGDKQRENQEPSTKLTRAIKNGAFGFLHATPHYAHDALVEAKQGERDMAAALPKTMHPIPKNLIPRFFGRRNPCHRTGSLLRSIS